ncbi:MAG TPA: hypothetical protein EYP86_04240 [Candidatus Altiarchaeales archaeon]|nr:hypothetical protein [Candidatus Altiarchaeales archaeon]
MHIELKYNSIEARRFNDILEGQINIKNNSSIISLSQHENRLRMDFIFTSTFEPNVGEIRIEGSLRIHDSEENLKRILDEWESSEKKNLPEDVAENIHNVIISNCITETAILAREVHLPCPIPIPKISINPRKDNGEDRSGTESYIR